MSLESNPLVSIIINNYNYDRFVSAAIDSALNQTYPHVEIIVVDDGSTDNSRNIIADYGNRIVSVLKSNSGQASSYNEGFKASQGEIICLLDSDDIFHQEKVEKIVNLFRANNLLDLPIVFFNSFEAIDEQGLVSHNVTPRSVYPDWSALAKIRGDRYTGGDRYFFNGELNRVCTPDLMYEFASKYRHIPYIGMPGSNMSLSRNLACQIFPLPVTSFKTCADSLLGRAASLLGYVYSTNLTLNQYRIHGSNAWFSQEATREFEESTLIMPDEYLNSKLTAIGKKPVFSFLESMGASGFYRHWLGYNSADRLITLAFKTIEYRLDAETCVFFISTLAKGIYYKLKLLWMDTNREVRP